MGRMIGKLVRDARGATAIEYGLIVAMIVVAMLSGIALLGGATGGMWGNIANKVVSAQP